MKNLFRVLQFFRSDTPTIGVVLGLLVLSTGANLLKPWPLAVIIDSLLGSKPMPAWLASWMGDGAKSVQLAILVGATLMLHIGQAALSSLQTYLLIKVGLRGLARVRSRLFHWLLRLSLRYHQGASQGDMIYRASWDTYAFQTLFQHGLFTFISAILALVLMVVVMWRLDLSLTLVALGTGPLLLLSMQSFSRAMSRRSLSANEADSRVTALVQQGIVTMPLTHSYTREALEEQRFDGQVNLALKERLSQHGLEVLYLAVIAVIFGMGVAGIVWLGAHEVEAGRLSVGQLLIFLAYLGQFYEPLNQLSNVSATAAAARSGTQRVCEILDTPEEVKEQPNAKKVVRVNQAQGSSGHREAIKNNANDTALASAGGGISGLDSTTNGSPAVESALVTLLKPLIVRGAIEFDNVSFCYQSGQPVLRGVSFHIEPGESTAIIGPSGVGKTTLIHLLPRFFDPTDGIVRLDGVDLRELRLRDLREQVALVMQESLLLPATIAENIACGNPDATPAEIEAAARAAYADGFIRQFPRKYDTLVGEGATRLSVGEKQRINLARAFLKDAPLLLLDEPTSALDAESERSVVASLAVLMRGRTTLIIAHRLSTIRQVKRILVMENGRITEQGTPAELLRRKGYFARVTGGQSDSFT